MLGLIVVESHAAQWLALACAPLFFASLYVLARLRHVAREASAPSPDLLRLGHALRRYLAVAALAGAIGALFHLLLVAPFDVDVTVLLSASVGALAWGGRVDLTRSLGTATGGSRGHAPDRATRRVTYILAFALAAAFLGAEYEYLAMTMDGGHCFYGRVHVGLAEWPSSRRTSMISARDTRRCCAELRLDLGHGSAEAFNSAEAEGPAPGAVERDLQTG